MTTTLVHVEEDLKTLEKGVILNFGTLSLDGKKENFSLNNLESYCDKIFGFEKNFGDLTVKGKVCFSLDSRNPNIEYVKLSLFNGKTFKNKNFVTGDVWIQYEIQKVTDKNGKNLIQQLNKSKGSFGILNNEIIDNNLFI